MHIKLNNLRKTYKSTDGQNIPAVDGITLEIPENTIYGIIGKSGAGKSSLVRLMSLLETPDSGEVFYIQDTKDEATGEMHTCQNRVDNLGKKELILQRRRIGMIFQNFNLFSSRTAAKNVAYPLEINGTPKAEIKTRVEEMLKLVGLEDRANAPVSTLSGGQKQRIAIARALATKPDILFCDEATSALDPQTTHSILELIREIQKKMNLTVVMITHQMEVVRDACEFVSVIDNGKVVESGTVKDIFSHPECTVTREFLSHISQNQEEENSGNVVRWSEEGGKYTLRFIGSNTDQPLLSDMVKQFDVNLNIRGGGIQHLPDEDIGTMVTDITGKKDNVKKAIAWLKEQGIVVEEN